MNWLFRHTLSALLFFAVALTLNAMAIADKSLVLMAPGQPIPTIYVAEKQSAPEKLAAQELKTALEKITGQDVNIDEWPRGRRARGRDSEPKGVYVAIGHSELTASLDTSELSTEQFIVEVTPRRLAIVGAADRQRGVLYGVYEVLDRLGVRWYRPEPWGEHMPRTQSIELSIGLTVAKLPDYEYRSTLAGGFQRVRTPTIEQSEQSSLWVLRNRLNHSGGPAHGGQMSPHFDHIYYQLITVEEYYDDHPEYFCLFKGQRRRTNPDPGSTKPSNPTGLQLCLSNPGLQNVFAEKIIAKAKGRSDLDGVTFSISPNDACPFCECDQCKAMDDPDDPGSMSNRLCAFSNIVARKVAQVVPAARLSLQAYSAWTKPPSIVDKMESNIVVHICLINEWADYTKRLNDPAPNWNLQLRDNITQWKQLGISAVYTYEYWSGYGWQGPLPVVRTMADRLRHYRGLNVRGIYNESHPHWGPQGLELYMCAKLLWNPDLNVQKELDLYYQNYYGPAAVPMKTYHETLMDALENHPHQVHSGGRGMHLLFTPQLIEHLGPLMAQAQEQVRRHPLYERRLNGVAAGYEFARRVCEILKLKKQTGQEEEMRSWPGRGYYLKSAEAEKAYDELLHWARPYARGGDAVFDIVYPPSFAYLKQDILEGDSHGFLGRESDFLKDFD
jgi:hypothetical protein